MKKFFSIIPLQPVHPMQQYCYKAVDNQKLQMQDTTSFPIIAAIEGYAEKEEEIGVYVLMSEGDLLLKTYAEFEEQLQEACERKQIKCTKPIIIHIPEGSGVDTHLSVFQKMIDYVEEDDELFACITFGTRPITMSLLSAIHYAYKIKKNTTISGIVYGEIVRPSRDVSEWYGNIYDMTALIQLDEIIGMLAAKKVADPERMIKTILDI